MFLLDSASLLDPVVSVAAACVDYRTFEDTIARTACAVTVDVQTTDTDRIAVVAAAVAAAAEAFDCNHRQSSVGAQQRSEVEVALSPPS